MPAWKWRFLRLAIALAAVHVVLCVATLLASFGMTMARFDSPGAGATSPLEVVISGVSTILMQPVVTLISLGGPGSHSRLVQWIALAANSLLWGLVLAAVFSRFTRPAPGRPANVSRPR